MTIAGWLDSLGANTGSWDGG
ncbi:MAG: hypothetical protein QOF06_1643, partial [Solirubrobacterales bacterium]|nr:hypothetical protein [Solirubrobacterales bacterium]MDX6635440.1 hypothetical protein [Solirubrobacterales bacterium]